jgi:hypothetical protein
MLQSSELLVTFKIVMSARKEVSKFVSAVSPLFSLSSSVFLDQEIWILLAGFIRARDLLSHVSLIIRVRRSKHES